MGLPTPWGKAQAQIYRVLLEQKEAIVRDVVEETTLSRTAASHRMRKMYEQGRLERELDPDANDRRGGPPYVYRIRDDFKKKYPTADEFMKSLMKSHMNRLVMEVEADGLV